MKLPVISGKEAVKAFEKLGYAPVRQMGQSYPNEASI
jgi:predicted RNA binding protein YcfA (HicA-like mRNA interferase family)